MRLAVPYAYPGTRLFTAWPWRSAPNSLPTDRAKLPGGDRWILLSRRGYKAVRIAKLFFLVCLSITFVATCSLARMKSFTLLPLGLAATATAVTGSVLPGDKQSVRWGPCAGFESIAPIECGNLTVPLDYTNSNSTETIQLELLKIPSTKKPSKGSIFINFGGPGAPGRLFMAGLGPGLQGYCLPSTQRPPPC